MSELCRLRRSEGYEARDDERRRGGAVRPGVPLGGMTNSQGNVTVEIFAG